jgi:L-threonylcarbamoyladenylate synthase
VVSVEDAARVLAEGGIVGVPTETVYGLAARGLDAEAVARIYAAKGRPTGHPLILHVLDAEPYGVLDDRARALIATFWPGPLTVVVPRRPIVPDAVTGGFPTVALRHPAAPVLRALIERVGPIAAPSANRFGAVSPTTAAHVLADFPDLPVVDGGECAVGVESTIVDLSGPVPALLRPGAVSHAALERILGPVRVGGTTAAPGTLASHYAPRARVVVTDTVDAVAAGLSGRVAILRATPPEEYAATLYAQIRALDEQGADVIVAEWCAEEGIGAAVNDRLRRAATPTS